MYDKIFHSTAARLALTMLLLLTLVSGLLSLSTVRSSAAVTPSSSQTVNGATVTNAYYYKFNNSYGAYFKKGQKGQYTLTSGDKQKLVNKLWAHYKQYYPDKKSITDMVNSQISRSWGGSCFGMCSTIALNRLGQINIRTYTKSKGTGRQLNKAADPKTKNAVKSAINYYQVSFGYTSANRVYYYKKDSNWTAGLKTVLANAKKKRLQIFDFYWKEKGNYVGHATLVKTYMKKQGNWYYLATYDPNYPGKKTFVRISTSFKTCTVQYYPTSDFIDVTTNLSGFSKIAINR